MIKTLNIANWRDCIPFAYYLNPLNDSINTVRKSLIDMHKKGHLLIRYKLEDNEELQDQTIKMLKADYLA